MPTIPAAGRRMHYAMNGMSRDIAFEMLVKSAHGAAVGWLPAKRGLIGNLRAWENIVLNAAHHGRAVDEALERQLLLWLEQVGYDAGRSAALLSSTVEALDVHAVRLACVLRVLAAQPHLVLVQSEWFARLTHEENEHYLALFAEHLPAAAWVSIGHMPPPPSWRFDADPPAEDLSHAIAG